LSKILIWDSDPVLRKAMASALSCKGYRPIALENPSQVAKALELEKPELTILEGDWARGDRINLSKDGFFTGSDGELAVIFPVFEISSSGQPESSGIVLNNLRKPFGIAELLSGLQTALQIRKHIESTPLPWEECLELRKLKTEEEIISSLKLRYETYREVGYINSNPEELEFDRYDFNSIFFGAFLHQSGSKELVGSMRIIQQNFTGPHKKELSNILRNLETGDGLIEDEREMVLPAFSSFNMKVEDFSRFCPRFGSTLSSSGEEVSGEIFELSRLVIKKEYWKHRLGIERKLYEMTVVDCCAAAPKRNWFVIAIHPSKSAKYERFGFKNISSLGVKSYIGISQPAVLMTWDLQQYLLSPNPFTKNLDFNTLIYKVNGNLLHTMDQTLLQEKVAI
jgi:hypothetical protein